MAQQQQADLASQVLAEATRPMSSVEYTRTGGDVQEYRKGYLPQIRAAVASVLSPARQAYEAYQRTVGQPFQQTVRGGIRGFFGLPIMSDADPVGREAYRQGEALGLVPGPNVPAGAGRALVEGMQVLPSAAAELATFIGAAAKTWDAASNAKAVQMEKAGANPRDIWRETGNWRAPDGKWRQEISDQALRVGPIAPPVTAKDIAQNEKNKKLREQVRQRIKENEEKDAQRRRQGKNPSESSLSQFRKLWKQDGQLSYQIQQFNDRALGRGGQPYGQAVHHPELLQAYPDLGATMLRAEPGSRAAGALKSREEMEVNIPRQSRSITAHESQHWVQGEEDFGRGGNPIMAFAPQNKEAFEILARKRKEMYTPLSVEEYAKMAWASQEVTPEIKRAYNKEYLPLYKNPPVHLERAAQEAAAQEYYRRLLGEAEARATQNRLNLSPAERRARFPLEDYDIPEEQLIVKRGPEFAFAEGGEVRPEDSEGPSLARQAYEAYQRAIGQPFQQAVRGGVRGYFGLPIMSDADAIGREAYRQGEAIGFTPGVGMPAGAVRAAAEGVQALPSIAGDLGRILSTIPFRGSGRGAPSTEVATQTPEFREVIPLPGAPAAAPAAALRLPSPTAPRLEGPTAAPALEAPVQAPRLEGPTATSTPLLEAPPPVLRLPAPAAAGPAGPVPQVARQPKAARPAAQPAPVSSSATREGNFYSPLDDFAQTLRGPVTKEQLLGQMKGKFRDHEIRRVEEILSSRGPRDKVQPQELQAALKQTYSPDKWITRVVPPDSGQFGRTKYFHGMDNPYTDRPLGVIHLYQKPPADQLAAFQQAEEAAKHLKALHGRMSVSATGYTTPDQLASVFKPLDTDPVLQRLPELPQIRQLQQEFMSLYQQQQQQLEYMQEAYNQAFWPTLSKRFIREKDQFPPTTEWSQIFRMEDELRDRIASEGRQEVARLFPNVDVTKASEVNNAVRASVSAMPITMRMTQVTDDMRTLLNASYDKYTSTLKPLYTGDPAHRSLKTPEGHIAFSRYSEHEADLPGIGRTKGIYVNELQSDLLDDLRKKGPRSRSPEADLTEIEQLKGRLATTALKDEERKALETRRRLLEDRVFRSRTPGQRTYALDEPFAQAETNRQAFQQLMVKNAVAAASEMGMNFVAFPGAESAQAQLYKNLPNNLKQVVKDLGPGFEYRSITLSGPKGEMMHPAIVWNPDGAAADRIRNQGIPFKDGGEVRRSTARQMLAELA